jgi:two-component system, LuxR family, sensor kinase FixL
MDWVTIIWTGTAASSLTLAAIHGFVWIRRRTEWASLMFCIMAAATAGMAACELWMMDITTVDELGPALRWYNFFRWLVTIALVGFMHFHLRAGRTWLELTVIGLRTAALLLNLFVSPNAYYSSVDSLARAPFLGQMVTIVEGTPNPLMLLGQVSLLVLAAYLVDTTWKGYTDGDHRRALSVGTTSVFFVLALSLQTMLVLWDVVDAPIMASLFFLGIVGAMAVELSADMLRSARLAENLQEREKDLLSERRLSEALFQGAPGPLFLAAPNGTLLRSNLIPSMESGRPESIDSHFREEDRPALHEALEKTVREGSASFELTPLRNASPDGLHFFQSVRITFGDAPHVVGMGVDITEPQALAMRLAEQKEHLARVSRIASMSELSSSLAHEINQPLAIILSNSQAAQRLLERDSPDLAELSEILKDIVSADIRAAEVIRRLRAILKRGEPVLEPVQAADMIDRVLQILEPALHSAGAAVSRRLPKRLPTLLADRIPIEQVLINLVQNALEAMADNGPKGKTLTISCAAEDGGIRFSIRDNGTGLPESADRIFEAFHSTKPEGLGLGLKICNTIVAAHGGRLWAENNKSRGASFHFHLPAQPTHP